MVYDFYTHIILGISFSNTLEQQFLVTFWLEQQLFMGEKLFIYGLKLKCLVLWFFVFDIIDLSLMISIGTKVSYLFLLIEQAQMPRLKISLEPK